MSDATSTNTTRLWVDGHRQIIVDWRVIEYWILKNPPTWHLCGLARMYRVQREGKVILRSAITETYEIVTVGETIEGAARAMMRVAWEQCIEGKPPTDTEH